MLRVLLASLLFVGLAIADDRKQEKKEPRKLDGAWMAEKASTNGEDSSKLLKSVVLTIDGEKYTVEGGGVTDKGTLKFDTKKDPAELDIVSTQGQNSSVKIPCIYKWDGDNVVVCYGLDTKTRPTDFTADKKSNRMLVTYKLNK